MAQPHAWLGTIPLELPTYMDRLDLSMQADFAEHAKVGLKPRLQHVGDKLDEVQIDAQLLMRFCQPELELAKLRDALRAHEAMQLIFANGNIVGRFVLAALEQRTRELAQDGTVLAAEVSLSLREYTDDGLGTDQRASAPPVAAITLGKGGVETAPAQTVTAQPTPRSAAQPVVRGVR